MDDLISRRAAIDAADYTDYTGLAVEDVKKVTDEVVKEIKKLPSAERTGHWVEHLDMHPLAKEESKYVCSCCGWRTRQVEVGGHLVGGYGAEAIGAEWVCTGWKDLFYKYCPNCGASMRGVEDD